MCDKLNDSRAQQAPAVSDAQWMALPAGPIKSLYQARDALTGPAADGFSRRAAIAAIDAALCQPATEPVSAQQAPAVSEQAAECSHDWAANSGRGGEPSFRLNKQMSAEPLMHVMCTKCGDRTWLTQQQWGVAAAPVSEQTAWLRPKFFTKD